MARQYLSPVVSVLAIVSFVALAGLDAWAQGSSAAGAPPASPGGVSAAEAFGDAEIEYFEEKGKESIAPQGDISKPGQFYPDPEYLRRFSHGDLYARMRRPSRQILSHIAGDPTKAMQEQHRMLFGPAGLGAGATTATLPASASETAYAPQPRIEPEPLYAPPAPPAKEGF